MYCYKLCRQNYKMAQYFNFNHEIDEGHLARPKQNKYFSLSLKRCSILTDFGIDDQYIICAQGKNGKGKLIE